MAVVPLSKEGSSLWVHESVADSAQGGWKGKLMYVPYKCAFVMPGTMAHAGGFRTGSNGNPRMHFVIFLTTQKLSDKQIKENLPDSFTQYYFGPGFDEDRWKYMFPLFTAEEAKGILVVPKKKPTEEEEEAVEHNPDNVHQQFRYQGLMDFVATLGC